MLSKPIHQKAKSVAAEFAAAADQRRSLSKEVVETLRECGFGRHFVPTIYGGENGDFTTLMAEVGSLGGSCASTGWCGSLYATCGRMASYLPVRGQEEIWGKSGPDVLISTSYRRSGQSIPTEDGWILSGQWHYLSGIEHAAWALVCFAPSEGGSRYGAVRVEDCKILDNWETLGMRGTGSHSISLDNIFVPFHRTFHKRELFSGRSRSTEGKQYQVSPIATDPVLFMAVALGSARDLMEKWAPAGLIRSTDSIFAAAYARSDAELDAAQLLLDRACLNCDQGEMSTFVMLRNARDVSLAAELVIASTERVFRLLGSHVHSQSDTTRKWRDIQTLVSHIGIRSDLNFKNFSNYLWETQRMNCAHSFSK
ncbi:hypothetical protein HFN86_34555 [Rhizobium laguerreae]|nr:hypothetical protein [Rhizobium laguerreae]